MVSFPICFGFWSKYLWCPCLFYTPQGDLLLLDHNNPEHSKESCQRKNRKMDTRCFRKVGPWKSLNWNIPAVSRCWFKGTNNRKMIFLVGITSGDQPRLVCWNQVKATQTGSQTLFSWPTDFWWLFGIGHVKVLLHFWESSATNECLGYSRESPRVKLFLMWMLKCLRKAHLLLSFLVS